MTSYLPTFNNFVSLHFDTYNFIFHLLTFVCVIACNSFITCYMLSFVIYNDNCNTTLWVFLHLITIN